MSLVTESHGARISPSILDNRNQFLLFFINSLEDAFKERSFEGEVPSKYIF